jgi:hypothetical protein
MTLVRRAVAPIAVLLLGFACAGNSDDAISTSARQRLSPLVDQIRRDAESVDRVDAEHTLATLRFAVADLQRTGDIGPTRAASVLAAATDVDHALSSIPTTTTTTTTLPPPRPGNGPHGKGAKDTQPGGNGDSQG